METRVGDWYLCERYIEEPVKVEALEVGRIQVRYLTSDKVRWLGYPRIWLACKPHPLPCEAAFDAAERLIVLQVRDDGTEVHRVSLGQLRTRFLPQTVEPPCPKLRKPRPEKDARRQRLDDEPAESGADRIGDEEGLEIDLSY